MFWTSSRYVEAAVVWPHFVMVNKSKQVRTVVFVYFAALGLYRLIYIADWGYKYYMSDHYDLLPVIPGSIHPLVFWILCLTKGECYVRLIKLSWFLLHSCDDYKRQKVMVWQKFNPEWYKWYIRYSSAWGIWFQRWKVGTNWSLWRCRSRRLVTVQCLVTLSLFFVLQRVSVTSD